MSRTWLQHDELKALSGWSDRKIQRMAEAREIEYRGAKQRASNGRRGREYLVASLPPDLQTQLARANTVEAQAIAQAPNRGAQLVPFRRNVISPEAPRIVLADPRAQAQAEQRLVAITPMLDYARQPTRNDKALWCLEHWPTAKNLEDLAAQIAEKERCSISTLFEWLKRYRKDGFTVLADQIRSDKGESRWFNQHPAAKIFAAYLYLIERMSVSFVWEQIEAEAALLGLRSDSLPSRETLRVFLSQDISPAMRTLAREGEREYRERMSPYLKRSYTDVFANQIWVGDHAIHDVEVQNDIFEEVPFGTPGRLRMSAFVDYRSRKAWATWAWEESARSIAATMLRGMLEDGPPEGIYVDNGKAYRKVADGATPASDLPFDDDDHKAPANWWKDEYQSIERTGLLARLGISVTHCIPRHPQSKHVERFFRTMHMRFDACHATYTSGSPFTRPEQTEKLMMRHRRLLKAGRVEDSTHPLASRFILGCLSWIREYNARGQQGEGMDGRSPDQIFAEARNPNQKSTPPASELAVLFAEIKRRTVHECAVRINNYRYTPAPSDRMGWAAMHEINEAGEVLVAYNPEDPEFCAVLDQDGRFVAWLEAEALARFAPNDPATQAQIAESMSIRRGLEKAAKTTLAGIAAAARTMGVKSAEELVYDQLQLPTADGTIVTQRKPRLAPKKVIAAPMTPAQVARMLLED